MNFIDLLLKKLGYVKADKPNSHIYPSDMSEDSNRQRILDDEPNDKELRDPAPVSGAPEQLSGNPNKQIDNHETEEGAKYPSPEDRVMNTTDTGGAMATDDYASIVTNLINNPRVIDVEEIDKLNHAIAQKMSKLGVRFVDREMFLEKYNKMQRDAALAKKPLSDFIEETI